MASVQQSSPTDSYAQAYIPLQDDAAYGQAVMGVQERTLVAPDGTQAREVISVRVPQRPRGDHKSPTRHALNENQLLRQRLMFLEQAQS